MTAFIQGTRSVGISGGNFRQTSYSEQHEHHTRLYREDKTIFQGNIYGYTHSATSDDGPIVAYSHTTNFTGPHYDGHSRQSFRSLPRGGDPMVARQTHQLPFYDTPLLGGTREHNRGLTVEERPASLFPQQTSEPSALPDLDDHELKAEFYTMSLEMQRYVTYMLEQLEKRTAASGDTVKIMNVAPVPRGSTSDPKPTDIHSESISSVHEPGHIANSNLKSSITSPHSCLSDHGAQSLSNAKPSMVDSATNKTQDNAQKMLNHGRGVPPDVAPKAQEPTMKNLGGTFVRKARGFSKIFTRPDKFRG